MFQIFREIYMLRKFPQVSYNYGKLFSTRIKYIIYSNIPTLAVLLVSLVSLGLAYAVPLVSLMFTVSLHQWCLVSLVAISGILSLVVSFSNISSVSGVYSVSSACIVSLCLLYLWCV